MLLTLPSKSPPCLVISLMPAVLVLDGFGFLEHSGAFESANEMKLSIQGNSRWPYLETHAQASPRGSSLSCFTVCILRVHDWSPRDLGKFALSVSKVKTNFLSLS